MSHDLDYYGQAASHCYCITSCLISAGRLLQSISSDICQVLGVAARWPQNEIHFLGRGACIAIGRYSLLSRVLPHKPLSAAPARLLKGQTWRGADMAGSSGVPPGHGSVICRGPGVETPGYSRASFGRSQTRCADGVFDRAFRQEHSLLLPTGRLRHRAVASCRRISPLPPSFE